MSRMIMERLGGGGVPINSGWNTAIQAINITNSTQNINEFIETATRYYAGMIINTNGNQNFRAATKAAPTVWTVISPPNNTQILSLCPYDDDTIFLGGAAFPSATLYRYIHSTNTFTNMNYPNLRDGIRCVTKDPFDPDKLYCGVQAQAAAGTADVAMLQLGSSTWTTLASFGSNTGKQIRSIIIVPDGRMFVKYGGGTATESHVYVASSPYTVFTKIAGDGVNGSWATGTFRGGVMTYESNTNTLVVGLAGPTNGDAEVWISTNFGTSWTKIGGDGLNGSWASGTKLEARAIRKGTKLIAGLQGSGANDGEVWQFDFLTTAWTQIGGDAINGSPTKANALAVYIDTDNFLLVGAGVSAVNQSAAYRYTNLGISAGVSDDDRTIVVGR